MIENYVKKLIDNFPEELLSRYSNSPEEIDIVLDGGLFNGSYLAGALYFLKEMERQHYVTIQNISGCSIGSLVAFLYFIDKLHLIGDLYTIVNSNLKKNYNLQTLLNIKELIGPHIPADICSKINGRLYISYYDIHNGKTIKSTYSDADEILYTIIQSCFIPYLIDGNFLHKERFFDGINPHFFPLCGNSGTSGNNRKILYLDLFGFDKINQLMNVKNETTNCHRILSGMLDIHSFYIKGYNTSMCSYIHSWTLYNYGVYYIKQIFEWIVVIILKYIVLFKNSEFGVTHYGSMQNTIFSQIARKIIFDIYIVLMDNYCV
jgi:hypothetical protein